MNSLNYVSAVVEDSPNVFRVDSACKMRIAMMRVVLFGIAARGLLRYLQEIVPDEEFGACKLTVRPLIYILLCLGRKHIVDKFWEIIF